MYRSTLAEARAGVWRGSGGGSRAPNKGPQWEGLCLWPSTRRYFGILYPALSLSGGHCCQFSTLRARLRVKWQWTGEVYGKSIGFLPLGILQSRIRPGHFVCVCERIMKNLRGSSKWAGLQLERIKQFSPVGLPTGENCLSQEMVCTFVQQGVLGAKP